MLLAEEEQDVILDANLEVIRISSADDHSGVNYGAAVVIQCTSSQKCCTFVHSSLVNCNIAHKLLIYLVWFTIATVIQGNV